MPTNLPSTLPPNGSAGGDLSGTYPNPAVTKLQGEVVSSTAPTDGQVLTYVSGSTEWEPKTLPSAAKCGAYCTSTQTIAVNTSTQITNWTVKFDTTSSFSTTNSNYIAPSTGYYHINTQFFLSGTPSAAAGVWLTAFVNNSATNDSGISLIGANSQIQVAYSTIVYATSGQAIDLRIKIGGSNSLTIQNNNNFNYMNIFQIL